MRIKEEFVAILAFVLLASACTTALQVFNEAQYEYERGITLFNQGKFGEAIGHFNKATEIDPNYFQAYLYLGRSYLSLNQWRLAITPLRTAYQMSATETKDQVLNLLIDALYGAAVTELNKGNFESSLGLFREVLQLQPKSTRAMEGTVNALLSYGSKLLSQGKSSEAVKAYSEALKFSPNNLQATLGLAQAYFRNGDFGKAMNSLTDALKIDPTNQDANSLLQNLRRR
jgi:tetratricopeptide (TPR) repeat protein